MDIFAVMLITFIIGFFIFSVLYFIYKDITSKIEFRNRLIQHMHNIEEILDQR